MVGQRFYFYGVDNNRFKLNNTVYEVIENEDDGYRSMLESVIVSEYEIYSFITAKDNIFFDTPLTEVTVVKVGESKNDDRWYYSFDGWQLVDDDGHVWLTVGTDNSDNYYPLFTFRYQPKE